MCTHIEVTRFIVNMTVNEIHWTYHNELCGKICEGTSSMARIKSKGTASLLFCRTSDPLLIGCRLHGCGVINNWKYLA